MSTNAIDRGPPIATGEVRLFADVEAAKKHAFVFASKQGNLPSALRDAVNVAFTLRTRLGVPSANTLVITDDTDSKQTILSHLGDLDKGSPTRPDVVVPRSKAAMLRLIRGRLEEMRDSGHHVLVTMSCHGYSGPRDITANPEESDGRDEYIVFRGERVTDDEWHATIATPMARIRDSVTLAVVDTCCSGTMMDLPWADSGGGSRREGKGPEGPAEGGAAGAPAVILAISACRDGRSSMDAIGTALGYGGGLTSALVDHVHGDRGGSGGDGLNVKSLFEHASAFLSKQGQRPVLSSNRRAV